MRIEVEIKIVYGKVMVYPVNEAAKLAAELIGAKTLQQRHIAILCRLGHEIIEINHPKLHHFIGHDAEGLACYLGPKL